MTAIYILLGLVIFLQTLILTGICRTNYKVSEIDAVISSLKDLMVSAIGAEMTNTKNIIRVLDQLADAVIDLQGKKKYKKKKGETFYVDNEPES